MRENRRGAPRQARAAGYGGRRGGWRDARGQGSAGRASGPGNGWAIRDGGRPGPGNRGSAPGTADTARVASLIEPVLHALEMDLEAVKIGTAGRRRVLRIIVDADGGVSLDDIAEVSREVSARLDAKDAMGEAPYTLEVSSPGVDRPLTQPRHWRRAIGRLVIVPLAGQDADSQQDAPVRPVDHEVRVIDADQERVTLEIDGAQRIVRYSELGPGRVQVEFGRLADEDDLDEAPGVGDPSNSGEPTGGPDEEEPDGH
jgi:ribosome maturation factor RimP